MLMTMMLGSSKHRSLFILSTAQALTQNCSSEDEEPRDGDEDVPMDEDLPEGQVKLVSRKPGDLSEYNLESYDDDNDNEAELGPFTNIKGLTYYRNNEEDPYITFKDVSSTVAPHHLIFTHTIVVR